MVTIDIAVVAQGSEDKADWVDGNDEDAVKGIAFDNADENKGDREPVDRCSVANRVIAK